MQPSSSTSYWLVLLFFCSFFFGLHVYKQFFRGTFHVTCFFESLVTYPPSSFCVSYQKSVNSRVFVSSRTTWRLYSIFHETNIGIDGHVSLLFESKWPFRKSQELKLSPRLWPWSLPAWTQLFILFVTLLHPPHDIYHQSSACFTLIVRQASFNIFVPG